MFFQQAPLLLAVHLHPLDQTQVLLDFEFFIPDDKLLLVHVLQVGVDFHLLGSVLLEQPVHSMLQLELIIKLEFSLFFETHPCRPSLEIIVFGEAVGSFRILQPVLEPLEELHGFLVLQGLFQSAGK